MSQAELISVASLLDNPIDQEKVPITWELGTGSVIDAEAIGVHVRALGRLAWTAGLSELTVSGYYEEQDESQVNAMHITGVNADGTATGSASRAVTRTKAFRVSLEDDNEEDFQVRRPACDLSIDRRELGSRIADDVRAKRMTREEAWAREVDRFIKRGILDASGKSLVLDPMRSKLVIFFASLSGAVDATSMVEPRSLILNLGIQQLSSLANGLIGSRRPVKQNVRIFKPNLFLPYGLQPDRFAYAALKASTRKLVLPMREASRR